MSLPSFLVALASGADALRDRLISWANINSGSGHLAGLEHMRTALRAVFGRLPGAVVDEPALEGTAATALRVRVRPEAPIQLLLSGHYDTVYGPDHPFQHCALLDPQTLRGPGVADMKGGLIVMLAALQAFEKSGDTARVGYEILLTPDEETGSVGSAPLFAEAAKRYRLALVFEPARPTGDLVRARMGIGLFTATCRGRAAHAGRDPSVGRNAILALCEYLPQADAIKREMTGVMINVGTVRGGGVANIVPDFAQAEINVRVARTESQKTVLERLRERAAPINTREGFRLEIEGRFNRPPKEVTPLEERLFSAWQDCGKAVGATFSWQDVGGGSDGNLLSAAGLPCLDGLGVVGDHLHSSEELVRLPSIVERSQIAALFLSRVAAREIELPHSSVT